MNNGTILIVEDEEKIAALIRDYLVAAGFSTQWVNQGLEVLAVVKNFSPDLILLDLMLPGKDGTEVCREIRAVSSVPIIMVTARIEEVDRLLGLELGADDYICKPFSPREVVARVKAVLKRAGVGMPQGKLNLDQERYSASLNGQELRLTAVEFKLLSFMAKTPGRIYSRAQLMDYIYPDNRTVEDRTIDSHVKKLRRKISQASQEAELIHSVYGVGYKYEE